MTSSLRALWVWAPAVAQLAAIFVASSLSDPGLPSGVSDKTGHFAGYALLAALLLRALAGARRAGLTWRAGAAAIALSSAYGMTDEFHQSFVPGRTPDPADWLADTTGAAVAVVAILLLAAILPRRDAAGPAGRTAPDG